MPDILFCKASWGEPNKVKTEKPDVDLQMQTALCTYGRDEEYLQNTLWLNGISTVVLYGVGDGMVPWCALQKRIPIMCLYDKELHKKTIEAHLLAKIIQKMEEATPSDTRWYRTAAQLGCCEGEDEGEKANAAAAKAKAAAAKTAAGKAKAKAKAEAGKRPRSGSGSGGGGSSSSSSSSKKPKRDV